MKKTVEKTISGSILLLLALLLLTHSDSCIALASQGLLLWYRNMIPSLFPFMVLSSLMIRTCLSLRLSCFIHKAAGWLLPFRKTSYFTILMGFLCGFPMGAKAVVMQLSQKQISLREGQSLLIFTNNIGPLYIFGYVFGLFPWISPFPFFFCLYGIPFLYGSLYYICKAYKDSPTEGSEKDTVSPLSFPEPEALGEAISPSLQTAISSITTLGGCMVFFQVLQILPQFVFSLLPSHMQPFLQAYLLPLISCLTEIGGGLKLLSQTEKLLWMIPGLLILGGGSCLLQTRLLLNDTKLSFKNYVYHKLLQAILAFLAGWLLLR
ncbi:MAG: hypothetical protein IJC59_01870 [Lachnospiraceae bacterium]|nr:hypothetical protein [Lachnospiraceae bacterium]